MSFNSTTEDVNPLDALESIDDLLGLGNRRYETADKGIFSEKDEQTLANIIKNGTTPDPANPNPQGNPPAEGESQLADYFEPYKDLIKKPLQTTVEDTTDYSAKAMQEFGNNFGHINTRDAFFEQLFVNNQEKEYLESFPVHKTIQDIIDGKIDKHGVLKNDISSALARKAKSEYRTVTQSEIDETVSRYFNTDGTFNQDGDKAFKELLDGLQSHKKGIEQNAASHARQQLDNYRDNNSALQSTVKDFSLQGIKLDEDLGAHVYNFINSGKLDEWESEENLQPKEVARRAILKALIADEQAFVRWLTKFDERSVNFGVNTVARTKFK